MSEHLNITTTTLQQVVGDELITARVYLALDASGNVLVYEWGEWRKLEGITNAVPLPKEGT